MNGIDDSPIAEGNHVASAAGSMTGERAVAKREALTIPLIAAPGIMTLASAAN